MLGEHKDALKKKLQQNMELVEQERYMVELLNNEHIYYYEQGHSQPACNSFQIQIGVRTYQLDQEIVLEIGLFKSYLYCVHIIRKVAMNLSLCTCRLQQTSALAKYRGIWLRYEASYNSIDETCGNKKKWQELDLMNEKSEFSLSNNILSVDNDPCLHCI